MDINKFLNNNVGNYKSITINEMIINFNINRGKAENIYNNWRKKYLMDYTPVNKLKKRYCNVTTHKKWTEEEKINVIELRKNGFKIKHLASMYGVSYSAMSQLLYIIRKQY